MNRLSFILLLIAFCLTGSLFAQSKFEKESRIKPGQVPDKARLFIDSLKIQSKVKWYKEESLTATSFEAKFSLNQARYSIEFDAVGNIEDVEIETDLNELQPELKDSVYLQLSTDCKKFSIVKVQRQYTGSESDLLSGLTTNNLNPSITINYELIVRCSQEKQAGLFEYLFDDKGKLISVSEIVFKNSSHLEY